MLGLLRRLSRLFTRPARRPSDWRADLETVLEVRGLEERLVFHAESLTTTGQPSATVDSGSPPASELTARLDDTGRLHIDGGTADAEIQLRVDAENGRLEISSSANASTFSFDLRQVLSIAVTTGSGNDIVAVDFEGHWNGSIEVNTGAGNDVVRFTGEVTAAADYQLDAAGNARLNLAYGSQVALIGLERVEDSLAALSREFTINIAAEGHVSLTGDGPTLTLDTPQLELEFATPDQKLAVRMMDTAAGGGTFDVSADITLGQPGGDVLLDAGLRGTMNFTGRVDVSDASANGVGGSVAILGDQVRVSNGAVVEASGTTGGGNVYLGGGYQGADARFHNATDTYFSVDSAVRANATESGTGGTIIVWADRYAIVSGSGNLSAQGGLGGAGGLIETSGKQRLSIGGAVNARGGQGGRAGVWLMDPLNVNIVGTGTGTLNGAGNFDPDNTPTTDSDITAATIVAALEAGTSVSITTSAPDAEVGNITVSEAIVVNVDNGTVVLTMVADNDIIVNAPIISNGPALKIELISNNGNNLAGNGDVIIRAAIATNGGDFLSDGMKFFLDTGGSINAAGGRFITGQSITSHAASAMTFTGFADLKGDSIALDGAFDAGTLKFDAVGSVVIHETSAMNLTGNNKAASAVLSSANGGISETGNTNILIVGGLLDVSGSSIQLGSGDLNAAGVTFNSSGSVTLAFQNNIQLQGINSASSLNLTVDVALTDAPGATVQVGNAATLSAGSITLDSGDFNSNTLRFTSSGAVKIVATDSISLFGVVSASSADLKSDGSITDVGVTSVGVSNLLKVEGSSIALGSSNLTAGSITFFSPGSVSISETNSTLIVGTNSAAAASISSGGALSDLAGTSITTVGLLNVSGTSIDLGNGTLNIGNLRFNTANTATIDANSAIAFNGSSSATNATLTSTGGITDNGGVSLSITSKLDIKGTSIQLGAGIFNAGTLRFESPGAVSILEDSAMSLTGANSAASAVLSATGSLSEGAGASLTVNNGLTVSGSSISLGNTGSLNAGTITFSSTGSVSFDENSSTTIAGNNSAGSLTVKSTGDIDDANGAVITVTNNASFIGDRITLDAGGFTSGTLTFDGSEPVTILALGNVLTNGANKADALVLTAVGTISDLGGSMTVTNNASFTSTGGQSIAIDNLVAIGTLTFNTTGSVLFNDLDSIDLVGINTAGSATLNATDALDDTGAASVTITNSLDVSGSSVDLGNGTLTSGSLRFNSAGAVTIDQDSALQLFGSSTAISATLSSTAALFDAAGASIQVTNLLRLTGTSITLDSGSLNAGTLRFNSAGAVVIHEASATAITGANTALSANITSGGALTDSVGGSILVTNLLNVSGTSITLGAGTLMADSLQFNSAGDVVVSLDSAIALDGASTANNATVTATGGITQTAAQSLQVTLKLELQGTSITLTNGLLDAGTLRFNSAGAVAITEASGMDLVLANTASSATLQSVNGALSDAGAASVTIGGLLTASGMSISLGGGTLNLGTVNFNSTGAVSISEDSATEVTGANTAATLVLNSTGALTDAAASSINVTGAATLSAASIALDSAGLNSGSLRFNSVGAVSIRSTADLNLTGALTANSADLRTSGAISDAAATSFTVTNLLRVDGSSISMVACTLNAGSLTFNSAGAVAIEEASGTLLAGINTALSATLISSGALTDTGVNSVVVTNLLAVSGTSVNLGDGTLNAGTLRFASTGAVTISEDSSLDLSGANSAAAATLTSTGAISDVGATAVNVTGLLNVSGTSIVFAGNTLQAASVRFNSAGAVVIRETDGFLISGANTALSAELSSGGAVSDAGVASIAVTNLLNVSGTSIALGAGTLTASSLRFNSVGDVAVSLDSAVALDGINTGNNVTLSATGSLTQAVGSSLDATAKLDVQGASITLDNGLVNSATLRFNSGGAVAITQNSGINLVGTNTADSATLRSAGAISDAGALSVIITNTLIVEGSPISLGNGLVFNVGALNFNSSGAVTLDLNAPLTFTGANTASSLQLTTTGAIADSPGSTLAVTGAASFKGTTITLVNGGFSAATLNFDGSGSVQIAQIGPIVLVGANKAEGLTLASTGSITDSGSSLQVTEGAAFAAVNGGAITLDENVQLGSLRFNTTGAVTVVETGGMNLTGSSTSGSLSLTADSGMTQAVGASLAANGSLFVKTNNGGAGISLNRANQFGSITFTSSGAVVLNETDGTALVGASTADSLALTSGGAIDQFGGNTLNITGAAAFSALGDITLTQFFSNFFGSVTVNTPQSALILEFDDAQFRGSSQVGGDLTYLAVGSLTEAAGAEIQVVGAAAFYANNDILLDKPNAFGTLTFSASGMVRIVESDGMSLTGFNDAGAADLQAAGALTSAAGAALNVVGIAKLSAASIDFAFNPADTFLSGSLTFNSPGNVRIGQLNNMTFAGLSTAGGDLTLRATGLMTGGPGGVDLDVQGNVGLTATGAIGDFVDPIVVKSPGIITATTLAPGAGVFLTGEGSLRVGAIVTNAVNPELIRLRSTSGSVFFTQQLNSNDVWQVESGANIDFTPGSGLTALDVNLTAVGSIRNLSGGVMLDTQAGAGSIALNAGQNIGSELAPIQFNPGTGLLQVSADAGDIFLYLVQGDLLGSRFNFLSAGKVGADIGLTVANGDFVFDNVAGFQANLQNDHLRLTTLAAGGDIRFAAAGSVNVADATLIAAGEIQGSPGGGVDLDTTNGSGNITALAQTIGETGNPFVIKPGGGILDFRALQGDLRLEIAGGDLSTSQFVQFAADGVNAGVELGTTDGDLTINSLAGIQVLDDRLQLSAGGADGDVRITAGITVRAAEVRVNATGSLEQVGGGIAIETTVARNTIFLSAEDGIGSAGTPFQVAVGELATLSIGDQYFKTAAPVFVNQLMALGPAFPGLPRGTVFLEGGPWILNNALTSSIDISQKGLVAGTGFIDGDLRVHDEATIGPGVDAGGAGILSVSGNAFFLPGSQLLLDINAPFATAGVDYDQFAVNGNVFLNDSVLTLVGGQIQNANAVGNMVLIDVVNPASQVFGVFRPGKGAILPDGKVQLGTLSSNIGYTLGDGNDVVLRDVTISPPQLPDPAAPTLRPPVFTSSTVRPFVITQNPLTAPSLEDPPLEQELDTGNVRKVLVMRLTPIDDEGNFDELILLRLDADWLRDLSAVFKSLPDDRYRLVLQMEGGELRRVMDVIIRGGRPFENESVQDATGADHEPAEAILGSSTEENIPTSPASDLEAPEELPPEELELAPPVAPDRQSSIERWNRPEKLRRPHSAAAALLALALPWSRKSWRDELDEALADPKTPRKLRPRWFRRTPAPRE